MKHIRLLQIAATCIATAGFWAHAQSVNVVEYRNKTLDAYFITGRANEQALLDTVADFSRTGMTFQATSAASAPATLTRICRFYVNVASPFVNSHFYGRQGIDCESLLASNLAGFNYEGYDFALQTPATTTCPVGTTTVYRSFRALAGGKTSNHRYTVSAATYASAAAAGYVGEGAAFCATAATDAAASVSGGSFEACTARLRPGDTFVEADTVSAYSLGPVTFPEVTRTQRTTVQPAPATALFNGRTANRITITTRDTTSAAFNTLTEFEVDDGGPTILVLGLRDGEGYERYNSPPIERPRTLALGQSRSSSAQRTSSRGDLNQTIVVTYTFTAIEAVTVPAGNVAAACKVNYNERYSDNADAQGFNGVIDGPTWLASGVPLQGRITSQINSGATSYAFTESTRLLSAVVNGAAFP